MSQLDLSEINISEPAQTGSKIVGYLAKAIPKKMIPRNKPVLEWLEGVDDPSPPRFRIMVVTDAEKKAFELLKWMNGHKFKAHVPLAPEPLDGDDGPISRQLHQDMAIPFVYDVVIDGQTLVFEWVISPVEDRNVVVDGFLKMPGTTKKFFDGCSREEYEASFIYMVKLVWNKKRQEQTWTSKAKAKVIKWMV